MKKSEKLLYTILFGLGTTVFASTTIPISQTSNNTATIRINSYQSTKRAAESPYFELGTDPSGKQCAKGEEYVVDKKTGEMWQLSPRQTRYTWIDAQNKATPDELCGYKGGWRLPNRFQLQSLTEKVPQGSSAFNWLATQGFKNLENDRYWTIDYSYDPKTTYIDGAYAFNMVNQKIDKCSIDSSLSVLMVHDRIRFIAGFDAQGNSCKSGEEVVIDTKNRKMWQKKPQQVLSNWDMAMNKKSNGGSIPDQFCGYSDWRLPRIDEFTALIDGHGQRAPYDWLNDKSQGFISVPVSAGFWSSTPDGNANVFIIVMREGEVLSERRIRAVVFSTWVVRDI